MANWLLVDAMWDGWGGDGWPVANTVSSVSSTTTSSLTDTPVVGMSITPWAWNYLAIFTSSWTNSVGWTTDDMSLYRNGVLITESVRSRIHGAFFGMNNYEWVAIHSLITWLLDWQSVDVNWKVSAWIATLWQREFTLIKMA